MATDRNGNEIDTFGIPVGPVEADPAACYHDNGDFKDAASQEAILRDSLARAGVELGSHDERIVEWFARIGDWSTFATVVSWINRASLTDPVDTTPGGTLPPPGPGLDRFFASSYAVDFAPGDDAPRRIWHITSRAVTEVPRERWTDRFLDMINRTKTRL